jgi:hypothetical protein
MLVAQMIFLVKLSTKICFNVLNLILETQKMGAYFEQIVNIMSVNFQR